MIITLPFRYSHLINYQLINQSKRLINKRWEVKALLEKLENPVNTIEEILQEKIHPKNREKMETQKKDSKEHKK